MTDSINMQKVAEIAGVHRTTVSMALKNNPKIPQSTRKRIQKIANDMGYRPNPMVSALMSQRRSNSKLAAQSAIAFVTNWETKFAWKNISSKYNKIYKGAKEQANLLGYNLEHIWLKEPGMTTRRVTKIMQTRGIYGIVVAPVSRRLFVENKAYENLNVDWDQFTSVAVGYTPPKPAINRVVHDYFHAMRRAIHECSKLGYSRFGLVLEEGIIDAVDHLWHAALLIEDYQAKRTMIPPLFIKAFRKNAWQEIVPWFRRHKPEIIISLHPESFSDILKDSAIRVPQDVGLVSLDKSEDTHFAGIQQEAQRIGIAAIELLVGQIHQNKIGIPAFPQHLLIQGEWSPGSTINI